MNSLVFTPSQRAAIEAPGSCTVRAGAGSGKTAVLTQRYIRAVDEGLEPFEIVAMTFTEKAAAEMRERIRDAIGEMTFQTSDDKDRLVRLQEELTTAPISTIHGFCSSILREFPIEAGVDPAFEVVEEPGARQLRREAVDIAIAAAADDPHHIARSALDIILSFYTRLEAANMLGDIVDKRRYFADEAVERLRLDPDALVTAWQPLIEEEALAVAHGIAAHAAVLSLRETLVTLAEECTDPADLLYGVARTTLDALSRLASGTHEEQLAAVTNHIVAGFDDGAPDGFDAIGAEEVAARRGEGLTAAQVLESRGALGLE